MRSRWLTVFFCTALLSACAAVPPSFSGDAAGDLSFALMGDAPYSDAESLQFDRMIEAINADASVQFVLHAGDIKGSGQPCSDALFEERFDQLQKLRTPLVFTPGDNEWTDCHRPGAGRHHPLERLHALRSLFFADPTATTGGARLAVTPQSAHAAFSEFVENVWFQRGDVLFATLHVVGSANDLEPWRGIDASDSVAQPRADRMAAFERRQAANLAWLDTVFEQAARGNARAVVLLMQANPHFESPAGDPKRAGFDAVIARFEQHARASGKPILLAHGDHHQFILDQPLPQAPNVTRVQIFGSPIVRWIKVTVRAGAPAPFRVQPQ